MLGAGYECLCCGARFDRPVEVYGEALEYFGHMPCREAFGGCPRCGSSMTEYPLGMEEDYWKDNTQEEY